jgi:hypothetical protein
LASFGLAQASWVWDNEGHQGEAMAKSPDQTKAKKFNPAEALPARLPPTTPFETLKSAGTSSSWGEARAAHCLLPLLAPRLEPGELTLLLIERGERLGGDRYGDERLGASPTELRWARALIDAGADPFEQRGPREELGFQGSFFEQLLKGQAWAYARALASASEQSLARARAVVEDMGKESTQRWTWRAASGAEFRAQVFERGGERGLALAFDLGVDPEGAPHGDPWVFSSSTAKELEAFAKAGARLDAKDRAGQGLRERFCSTPSGALREGLLSALTKLGGDGADEKQALKALGKLAATGKWTEVAALAKEAHADPLTTLVDGSTLVGLAMGAGNWELAGKMVEKGADLWTPCALSGGGPAILAVGWGPCAHWSDSAPKRARQDAARELIANKIDWSWRSASGQKFLEAALAAHPSTRSPMLSGSKVSLGLEAIKAAIKKDPIDPTDPLWSRLARLDSECDWVIREAAVTRAQEPWIDAQGKALMAVMIERGMSKGIESSMGRGLAAFEEKNCPTPAAPESSNSFGFRRVQTPEEVARRDEVAQKLCSDPRHWEQAFEAAFARGNAEMESPKAKMFHALAARMERWLDESARLGVEAFDFKRLGKALAHHVTVGGGEHWFASESWPAKLAKLCVAKRPQEAGWIFLDLVEKSNGASMKVAREIWSLARQNGVEIDLPGEHRLMREPGAVDAKLASDPLWVSIEEAVVARASRPRPKL